MTDCSGCGTAIADDATLCSECQAKGDVADAIATVPSLPSRVAPWLQPKGQVSDAKVQITLTRPRTSPDPPAPVVETPAPDTSSPTPTPAPAPLEGRQDAGNQETSDEKSGNSGTQSATKTQAREGAQWNDLDAFLDELVKTPPTVAVIGRKDSGKSFFIDQAAAYLARGGGKTRRRVLDTQSAKSTQVNSGQLKLKDELDPELAERIGVTVKVTIIDVTVNEDSFRLIDLPGEFFDALSMSADGLGPEGFETVGSDDRVAKLYAALAAADAIVLLVPAPHVFGAMDDTTARAVSAQRGVAMLDEVRKVSNLLSAASARHATTTNPKRAAVLEGMNWSASTREQEMEKYKDGMCGKPVLALFSQSDRCFGVGIDHNPLGHTGAIPEHDPVLSAVRELPALVNGLYKGFVDFHIDFMTASEGHPVEEVDRWRARPALGIRGQVDWLKRRIALRRAGEPPLPAWVPRFLCRGRAAKVLRFLLAIDGDEGLAAAERRSGWAIELRRDSEREFRNLLRR